MRSSGGGGGSAASRSIAHRNAASVLPEPVGARISVWSPRAIDAQPSRWAGVGSSNVASNHARTAGEKTSSVTGTPYSHPRTTGEPPLGCGHAVPGPTVDEPCSRRSRSSSWRCSGPLPRRPRRHRPSPSPRRRPGPRRGSAGNQVVLVGRVVVPRGQSVGEVIVFSGRVVVEGIVRGDVVVVDGPITVSGQVSGSVVALSGSVRLLDTAQIGGDVLAHGRVGVAAGASVQGRMSQDVSFTLSRSLRTVAAFVSWLAVAVSTLLLGLLFVFVAPRALERTRGCGTDRAVGIRGMGSGARARRSGGGRAGRRVGAGHPARDRAPAVDRARCRCSAWSSRRRPWDACWSTRTGARRPRSWPGWGIATVLGVIPYVSGVVYGASAIFGLGAATVAIWRARGPRREARPAGKHRAGAVSVPVDPTGSREAPGL